MKSLILMVLAGMAGCVSADSQRHREVLGPAKVNTVLATPWGTQTFTVEIGPGGRVWFGPDYHAVGHTVADPELEEPEAQPDAEPEAEPDAPAEPPTPDPPTP